MGSESSRFLVVPPYPRPFCYTVPSTPGVAEVGTENYYLATLAPHWQRILEEHMKSCDAISKFSEVAIADFMTRWPDWSATDIMSLRDQFMAFDINSDGLIDYNELNNVLDIFGDRTSPADRKEYFKEIDTDGSEGIDFEEFLEVVHHQFAEGPPHGQGPNKPGMFDGFGKMYEQSTRNKTGYNRLNVNAQLEANLI